MVPGEEGYLRQEKNPKIKTLAFWREIDDERAIDRILVGLFEFEVKANRNPDWVGCV